ncbi:hypothetical protein ACFCVO_19060 [Agromyces sp. NPDC056379]|uniref:hypothetical protein n=1 Tax=unclassified Agromyces TaxID=2639701 RepID=UPI0035DDBD19
MSDGATTGIDPRFDPRYQRGYSGGAADAASPPVPAALRIPEPPESMRSRIAPTNDRAPVSAPAAAAVARAADIDDPELFAGWVSEAELASEAKADLPFLTAWAVSAAAVIIGAALLWTGISSANYFGPSTESDRVIQMLSWSVAPPLLQAGLLGIVGMLVWSGIRRARAQSSSRPARGAGPAEVPGARA